MITTIHPIFAIVNKQIIGECSEELRARNQKSALGSTQRRSLNQK